MKRLILTWLTGALFSFANSALGIGTVQTTAGYVKGISQRGTTAFLGVPFAAPPVGSLRLRPPVVPRPWVGIRNANALPPMCAQIKGIGPVGEVVGSEDCLYLNVWVPPSATSASKLPVMVFIHGGGLIIGSSSDSMLNGANLAARGNVIVVTVQYRLGNLGYMAHPALSAESVYGGSGNYGLMDQIAALRWVKANAAKFGGEPNNVTLFGESGGGAASCALLASPLTTGLFARVIIESGGCPAIPKQTAESEGLIQAAMAGCFGTGPLALSCLRSRPLSSLLQAGTYTMVSRIDFRRTTSMMSVDGFTLPEHPQELIRKGKGQPVPLLMGNNANEGMIFIPYYHTPQGLKNQIRKYYGEAKLNQLYSLYPPVGEISEQDLGATVFADLFFECPTRRLVRSKAESNRAPVYRYVYNYVPMVLGMPLAPAHGTELPFVFQNFADFKPAGLSEGDKRMEATFLSYWTQFAKTGTPNSAANPEWSDYRPDTDNYLVLNPSPYMSAGRRSVQCDFADTLK